MAHQNDRAIVHVECFDQGFPGINVEMVRRFIQQHEMGMARTHEAEKKTRLLSPRKVRHFGICFRLHETEAPQLGSQTGLLGHWKERVEMVVGGGVGLEFFRLMLGKVADFEFP